MQTPPLRAPATILIVDDHPAIRDAVMALLDGVFPECQLLVAESAEVALALCATATPDVVIMDISLPGMNGIEATQHIRIQFPTTRVVMHSNSDMQVFRDESAAAGAAAFVCKGRTSCELVTVISQLLRATV
ncbi:MAG: response regulator transcription factor [Spongiibacteraceae bacterium]